MKENEIQTLTLISSCACNLKCKYCYIDKNIKALEHIKNLQENTIKAFQDGSFLKTTIYALKRFKTDPSNIRMIDFWGQEPTLTLKYFIENLKDWLDTYPNLDKLEFSTNGIANTDILINYIKAVDKISTRPITIALQFSYDGKWATKNIRGADPDLITTNAFNLLSIFCDEYHLKNVKLDLSMHNVISYALLDYLYGSFSNIEEYENELTETWRKMEKKIQNRQILTNNIRFFHGCGPEVPGKNSANDGKKLTEFLASYLLKYPDRTESPILELPEAFVAHLLDCEPYKRAYLDIPNGISHLLYDKDLKEAVQSRFFCGAFISNIKIMYDGTILTCQNFLHDTNEDITALGQDPFDKAVRLSMIRHKIHFNIFSDSDQDLEKTIKIHAQGKDIIMQSLNQCATFILLMARCGQANISYLYDKEKLLKHAFFLIGRCQCQHNNQIMSGSQYLREASLIRLYCNGLLDLLDKYIIK